METGVASPSLELPLALPPSFTLFSFLPLPRSPSDPVQPSQASTALGTKEAVMGTEGRREGREEGPEQTMPISQGRAGRGGVCTAAKGLDPPESSGGAEGLQEGTWLRQGCWHKWGGEAGARGAVGGCGTSPGRCRGAGMRARG